MAFFCFRQNALQTAANFRVRAIANEQGAAQRRINRSLCLWCGCQGQVVPGDGGFVLVLNPAGDVFLQHGVKIGAAEPKSADTGPADTGPGRFPFAQLSVHKKGRIAEIDIRVRTLEIQVGWQQFVAQGKDGFKYAGGAGRALQMADVGFYRAQGHRLLRQPGCGKRFVQAFHFGHIADAGRGAVAFDQADRIQGHAGVLPATLHGQSLADGIRRRDAFAFAITGAAHAANDRVNGVAGLFGIGKALENEDGCTFAHHEAIGASGIRARAGSGQRADFAKFNVRGRAHVGVDTTGDRGVEIVLRQALDGRTGCRHGRSACRVGHEIRAAEIVQGGDAPGDDIGQFAWHGVFGDLRKTLVDTLPQFV